MVLVWPILLRRWRLSFRHDDPEIHLAAPRNAANTADMRYLTLFLSGLMFVFYAVSSNATKEGYRTLVVRERAAASLLDDSFTFRVMKLKGYSINIMFLGEKRKLKLGDSFGPADSACTVVFEEISPETRIARFQTNCR